MCPGTAVEATTERTALERFRLRVPGTVRVANVFEDGARWVRGFDAGAWAEIAPDPPGWLTSIRLDVDRRDARDAALLAQLPPPNLTIERASNGHAHLVWDLEKWVRCERSRAMVYAADVRAAMTAAISGADRAYNGTFVHNPLSDAWIVTEGPAEPYTLAQLAAVPAIRAALDARPRRPARHRHLTIVPTAPIPPADPNRRNCSVFDALRIWAYAAVAAYADEHAFRCAVHERADAIGAELGATSHKGALGVRELAATARSVARYVWARRFAFGAARRERRRVKAETKRRSSGAVERATYLAPGAERARLAVAAAAAGRSLASIAAELGVAIRTVQRYLARFVAPVATGPCPISGRVDPLGACERAQELDAGCGFAASDAELLLEYARVRLGEYESPVVEPRTATLVPISVVARSQLWLRSLPRPPRRRFHARI